jgi:hypothetical protein
MPRMLTVVFVLGVATVGVAFAQTAPANPAPIPPVIWPPSPDAPGAAAKSLNASEARRRLEAEGYTHVTGLKMDSHSMWRGKAMKAGKSVNVAIDDQGNVVTRK